MEWTDMMHYQQQMQKIIRALLPVRKSVLTVSECELLAHLYLQPFYDLWRSSEEDFEAFMYYADKLATQIEKGKGNTRNDEVL